MSDCKENVMQEREEIVDDENENNNLSRMKADNNEPVNRGNYNRIDLTRLKFGDIISSEEALKDVVNFNWHRPDDEE